MESHGAGLMLRARMTANTNPQVPNSEISREVLDDFMDEFREMHGQCEAWLMELERKPDDEELLRSLFRAVHTVKGNLSYVLMYEYIPLLQSVEDVLDEVRNGRMRFDDALSDVILLSMDTTQRLVTARMDNLPAPVSQARLDEIRKAIGSIVGSQDQANHGGAILRAIRLLDPTTSMETVVSPAAAGIAANSDVERILAKHGIALEEDLAFFYSLVTPLEDRSAFWNGRTERLLELALAMNSQAGDPVNPRQLAAAVFIHDMGMAFLPVEMLQKSGRYSEEEKWLARSHPLVGMELLGRMISWRPAAEMVFQHHERSDGSGYPQGLRDGDICDGAKIIGIVESFDACTHARAHRTVTKRPFIRAVMEINRCSGQLFSEYWVKVFNEAVRGLHDAAEAG